MLSEFRRTNQHMAIVVDEYGAMEGIVTLEDLLEEIVGEIEDEFDLPDESVERVDDDTIRIDGTFPIDDFNEQFATRIPIEDYHSMGGFVFGLLGRARRGRRLRRLRRPSLRRARGRGPAHPSPRGHVRRAPGFAEGSRGRGLAGPGPILGRIAPTTFSETSEPQAWPRPRGFPRPERLSRSVDVLPGRRPGRDEAAGQARPADDRRPARAPPAPLRSRRRGGADRRPARRRGGGRDLGRGRPDDGPPAAAAARDRPGAHRRRQRADHGRLVQPGVARGQAQAGHARPPARPSAAQRVQRALVRPERRLGDGRLRARLSGDRGS